MRIKIWKHIHKKHRIICFTKLCWVFRKKLRNVYQTMPFTNSEEWSTDRTSNESGCFLHYKLFWTLILLSPICRKSFPHYNMMWTAWGKCAIEQNKDNPWSDSKYFLMKQLPLIWDQPFIPLKGLKTFFIFV